MNILLNNSGYRLADIVTDREVEEIMVAVAQSEFEFLRLVDGLKRASYVCSGQMRAAFSEDKSY